MSDNPGVTTASKTLQEHHQRRSDRCQRDPESDSPEKQANYHTGSKTFASNHGQHHGSPYHTGNSNNTAGRVSAKKPVGWLLSNQVSDCYSNKISLGACLSRKSRRTVEDGSELRRFRTRVSMVEHSRASKLDAPRRTLPS